MNIGSQVRAAALPLLGALALGGCVAVEAGEAAAPVTAGSPSAAEDLAVALARADAAFAAGDKARLTAALRRIDALGGRPLDETVADPLPEWRRAAADGQPPMRGRALGPGFRRGQLAAGQSERIEQVFLAGERASLALSSPNEAELTLHVAGARDTAVCGRRGNPSLCRWVPAFTERFRITVTNDTRRSAGYFLVIE